MAFYRGVFPKGLHSLSFSYFKEEDALVLASIGVEEEDWLDGVVGGKAGGTWAEYWINLDISPVTLI